MPEAGVVVAVHVLADLAADDRADRGAGQDRDQPVIAVGDRRADGAADDGAQHRADAFAVAVAFAYAVVVVPAVTGVADVVGVVLLPPAVCRRMRRRVGERGG